MEVGMALAIKTLADDFQPLSEVYKSFIDEALMAEDLGFDYISTSEHHFEDDAWSPSQLPILANIAGRTSRIRLHTNVFLLPLHHPLRVAEDAATVDILSNGRLDLVCGTGSVEEEFVAFGVDPKTRWSRFWEEMEILRLVRRLPSHSRSKASTSRSRGLFARPRSPCNSRSRCGWVVWVRSCSTTRACAGSTPRAVRSSVPSTSKD